MGIQVVHTSRTRSIHSRSFGHILDDKAYGSEAIRNWITAKQASNTIPPKRIVQTHGTSIGIGIKNAT